MTMDLFRKQPASRIVLACTAGLVGYVICRIVYRTYRRRTLRESVREFICKRDLGIERIKARINVYVAEKDELSEKSFLTQAREVTSLKLSDLIEKLNSGELTPTDVLICYQAIALEAHRATNCLCWFIDQANDWAKELEQRYTPDDRPLLYGVPVSIKESIQVKGYVQTAGYAARARTTNAVDADADVVHFLKEYGAIPFCTTNVPQTLFSYNCSNPVYGRTVNPANTDRTVGGSSGGEAALVAFGGSLLGLGSDVAGGIRVPAHYCGVVGFKPGTHFGLYGGSLVSTPGRAMVHGAVGPIARDVETLQVFCALVAHQDNFNGSAIYWPPEVDLVSHKLHKRLRIGLMYGNGTVEPTPDCRNAVEIAAKVLEEARCEIVPFKPPNLEKAVHAYFSACLIDGGDFIGQHLRSDIVDDSNEQVYSFLSRNRFVQHLILQIRKRFDRNASVQLRYEQSTVELRKTFAEITTFLKEFKDEWKAAHLDAVISPVSPSVAPKQHEHLVTEPLSASYNIISNLLDCPSGCLPVCKSEFVPTERDLSDLDWFTRKVWADGSTPGLPVGVQVITMPHEEKLCLKIMKLIEEGGTRLQ